jgi:hypothetical protein
VYFNGSDWVAQSLPEIPDSTDVGILSIWAASDDRAYAVIGYENTTSTDTEMKLITWDGASWALLAEQPELPPGVDMAALHGFQAGEIYLQLTEKGNQTYRYQSCEQ